MGLKSWSSTFNAANTKCLRVMPKTYRMAVLASLLAPQRRGENITTDASVSGQQYQLY